MTDIEFAKRVAMEMSRIDRREIMETNSRDFVDMVDKISDYLFRLSHKYLKENGVTEDWIENDLRIKNNSIRKQKDEDNKKWMENNYLTDGFGNYWNPICNKCGKKSIEIVRPGKVQCNNCE